MKVETGWPVGMIYCRLCGLGWMFKRFLFRNFGQNFTRTRGWNKFCGLSSTCAIGCANLPWWGRRTSRRTCPTSSWTSTRCGSCSRGRPTGRNPAIDPRPVPHCGCELECVGPGMGKMFRIITQILHNRNWAVNHRGEPICTALWKWNFGIHCLAIFICFAILIRWHFPVTFQNFNHQNAFAMPAHKMEIES